MTRGFSDLESKRLKDGRYAYYPADGAPVYLVPGVDAAEEVIIMLQEMDDEATRQDRREEAHRFPLDCQRTREVDHCNSEPTEPLEEIADRQSDPFSLLFPETEPVNEALCVLEECILQLTDRQQDCIRERFGMQLGFAEIAERDGVTAPAISNRISKICKRLKKLMAERGIG